LVPVVFVVVKVVEGTLNKIPEHSSQFSNFSDIP
jgi:hypothetical protein